MILLKIFTYFLISNFLAMCSFYPIETFLRSSTETLDNLKIQTLLEIKIFFKKNVLHRVFSSPKFKLSMIQVFETHSDYVTLNVKYLVFRNFLELVSISINFINFLYRPSVSFPKYLWFRRFFQKYS